MRLRRIGMVGIPLVVLAVLGFFFVVPDAVAQRMNRVVGKQLPVSAPARALHQRLRVADLHADSLLWGRDLLKRSSTGHVDVPRLVEGRVALQVFDVVTKTPRGLNIEHNDDRTDNILPLAVAQRWPPATWTSLKARALYQAERLADAVARSNGSLRWVRSSADLQVPGDDRSVACLLGLEGAHALEGNLENIDALFAAGFRIVSPSHFFDTDLGGSASGVHKGGLTALGRAWVRRMEERRMVIDLAHASEPTIDEVLALATRPLLVSHTGLRGSCANQRNLSDDQARRIAAAGGLIGIGFWSVAVCGRDTAAIARSIVYAVRLLGADHVALGSDYDGAVDVPFDASAMAQLTDALLAAGLREADVARVMGENTFAFFAAMLP